MAIARVTTLSIVMTMVGIFSVGPTGWAAVPTEAPDHRIRAGREVAVESCTGCHMVTRHQEFRPIVAAMLPSFEEIANRKGATEASLREAFDKTHRSENAPTASSIYGRSFVSDKEAAEVIAYIMTKRLPR